MYRNFFKEFHKVQKFHLRAIADRIKSRQGLLIALAFLSMGAAAYQEHLYDDFDGGTAALVIYTAACIVYLLSAVFSSGDRPRSFDELLINNTFQGFDLASKAFRKGISFLEQGCLTMALEYFRKTDEYELKPREKAVLYYFTGTVYRAMNYPTNSAMYYEKSADAELLHPSVLLKAEREYSLAGNIFKTEEILERMYSLDYDKKYYDFLEVDRGRLYMNACEPEKAEEIFLHALEIGNDPCGCLCGLAVTSLLKDEVFKSREYYRKAVVCNDFSSQNGFTEYYAQVAQSRGLYDEVKDMLPHPSNEDEKAPEPMSM